MDSDGTLATVTYLPGALPPHNNVQRSAVAPGEEPVPIVPSELTANPESDATPELAAPTERTLRRAENISLSAFTRRGRSRWELGQVLLARELEEGVVEAELDRLEGVGLIDDDALAEQIVRTQHERKGLGRAALLNEMRRKHIDQSSIDAALEQLGDDDELQRALQLAERRVNQLRGLDHDTAVRRLSGFLQRKGYSSDTVRSVVVEVLPRSSTGVRFT